MFPLLVMFSLLYLNEAPPDAQTGRIDGTVINGTLAAEPIRDAVVVLRAGTDGALMPVAETRTDWYGKFAFDGLPLDREIIYLPGADVDGIHYPGQRVWLHDSERFAFVTIAAFEAIHEPSPLISPRHEIDIDVQSEVLEIVETLLVRNPRRGTYVGKGTEGQQPLTLRLALPPMFQRVTFDSEFHGRRFWIADHQPVTDIPWPPGERKLTFRYSIPLERAGGTFCRRLDIPCDHVRLRVRGPNLEHVSCSLSLASATSDSERIYETTRGPVAAGYGIELQIGRSPFPWKQFARWGSIAVLGSLIIMTAAIVRHQR
jgi:hypothetical protein